MLTFKKLRLSFIPAPLAAGLPVTSIMALIANSWKKRFDFSGKGA
jgi:hypothetical protein